MVLSRSYYLNSGEYFLLWILYSSQLCDLSISCIRTASLQSRNDLLVYLGGAYRESLGDYFSLN
jgi:hypothetical protein